MFEVLAFVYENYFADEDCPEPAHLQRKLSAVGFETDEINDAITWLEGLQTAAHQARRKPAADPGPASMGPMPEPWLRQPSATSIRIYPSYEQNHLGPQCLGFIRFLETAGVLPAHLRELVLDLSLIHI